MDRGHSQEASCDKQGRCNRAHLDLGGYIEASEALRIQGNASDAHLTHISQPNRITIRTVGVTNGHYSTAGLWKDSIPSQKPTLPSHTEERSHGTSAFARITAISPVPGSCPNWFATEGCSADMSDASAVIVPSANRVIHNRAPSRRRSRSIIAIGIARQASFTNRWQSSSGVSTDGKRPAGSRELNRTKNGLDSGSTAG